MAQNTRVSSIITKSKGPEQIFTRNNDSESTQDGYMLDAIAAQNSTLKTTQNGRIILVPQPSDDLKDPLNWSWAKKHIILFTISAVAFLPDYGSSIGAVTLIPQSIQWQVTQDGMLRSLVGNVFMEGAAGPFIVVFMAYFGRLPVLFWFTLFALWTAAFCAGSKTLDDFIGARILNGTFSTVAQAGGLILIKDMFFIHEYARKINIWAFFFVLSPYMGPLITAFIISKYSWTWAFWLYTLMTGLCLIAVVLLVDETYYNRHSISDIQPNRNHRIMRLIGIEQFKTRHQRISFIDAMIKPIIVILQPVVAITWLYTFMVFPWVIGVNTTLSIFLQPLYGFGPRQIGFFYFTPIIGTILGEISGHFLHDQVSRFAMKQSCGRLYPEARLWVVYISTPFMVAGLALLGECLQHGYHYMVTAVGWGLFTYGIMLATVGTEAYLLDSYPMSSGEIAAWLNFGRCLGGFFITYFQVRWAQKVGPRSSFGTQAGIVAGACLLVIFLQIFGRRLRKWSSRISRNLD